MAAAVHRLSLYPGGRWFSAAGVRELPAGAGAKAGRRPAIEVVLGEGIAREMGRYRQARPNWPRPATPSGSTWATASSWTNGCGWWWA